MSTVSDYVDEQGHEIHLTYDASAETFAARRVHDEMLLFVGSWDAFTHYGGSQDWKHVDTDEGKRRLAARVTA